MKLRRCVRVCVRMCAKHTHTIIDSKVRNRGVVVRIEQHVHPVRSNTVRLYSVQPTRRHHQHQHQHQNEEQRHHLLSLFQ